MNREIKFRAWSKRYKRFLNDCEYPIGSDASIFVGMDGKPVILNLGDYQDFSHDTHSWARLDYDNDLEIIWSTGLKDKNGKEIYEGDLLEVLNNKNGALTVEFKNSYVGGWVLTHYSTEQWASLGARKAREIEVIGNIYENPEILENDFS